MLYELTTLSCPLLSIGEARDAAQIWMANPRSGGELLGCWRTELGTLGRLLILRGFETPEALAAERERALLDTSPFNAERVVTGLEMVSYAPFPFLSPIRIGKHGSVYEFRIYRLKPGGLAPTLAGWEAALAPARDYTDHLIINMYALDGEARITHIWAFDSLDQRARLRSEAYGTGVWPPKGGPEQIVEATSTIALPEAMSPLA
jgi:hypothetical protein